MRIIRLCGRSGSGKTTAAQTFRRLGCDIIDADEIARAVMGAGSPCLSELSEQFGNDIIRADGTLDRKLLASRAFCDREKAALLNSITHKYIVREIDNRINTSDAENIIIDAPLLFEAGLQEKCSAIIGVIAPDTVCVERAAKRDGITEEEVEHRLRNQHGNDYLLTYCTHILNNSGTVEELDSKAAALLNQITGGNDA